ncbi:argininosuccinate synthase domain-containing protein [Amycolatopsis aidingensis]|uniref:argininosuccinate synthase domain-containing protein n=1 Tax=Amycolatopsis aidingensis TaxID=2842453 RepID=UPI001C0CD883|nr:argininosuccinate synthase domain-containing protein [Amycolatopsis aidingensis]
MDLTELREKRVGVLASGGLSATTIGAWLADNGVQTVSYIADIGQDTPFGPAELSELFGKMGLENRVIDLRAEMATVYLDLIRYQATYEGGYWNTTGAARRVLVEGLADELRKDGCAVLVHGCVGGGNDQTRFARYSAALAPELTVFTPWTRPWLLERFPNRESMTDYLLEQGYPTVFADYTDYSVDGNLGGYSHESGELEDLDTRSDVVSPILTSWPQQVEDAVEAFRVRFTGGRPVEINGSPVDPVQAILTANAAGRRNGISLRSVVENRVNGTKCRGVYEAPGLEVLGQCLNALYQTTLDKEGTELARQLFQRLGRYTYEGRLTEPAALAARSAADLLTERASGTVEVNLYKGNVIVNGVSEVADVPGAERQTRFTNGGHAWHVQT